MGALPGVTLQQRSGGGGGGFKGPPGAGGGGGGGYQVGAYTRTRFTST